MVVSGFSVTLITHAHDHTVCGELTVSFLEAFLSASLNHSALFHTFRPSLTTPTPPPYMSWQPQPSPRSSPQSPVHELMARSSNLERAGSLKDSTQLWVEAVKLQSLERRKYSALKNRPHSKSGFNPQVC